MRERSALRGTALCTGILLAGTIAGCGAPGNDHAKGESVASADSLLSVPVSDAGAGTIDASPSPDGGSSSGPSGEWHFDDCSSKSKVLVDSSGGDANATHHLGSTCVAGVSGLAVSIRSASDVVEIPDEPQFAVTCHIAVAAWIKPTQVSGTHPIVVKGSGNKAPFSLSVQKGSVVFSVQLSNGRTVTSSAPISANVWSHVGAFYDGQFVFLFLDGVQVGQIDSPGKVADARDSILVGASSSGQYFEGAIDELWISTNPVTAGDITSQACIARPMTFAVSQTPSGPVSTGTAVNYSVTVTDNDFGFCPSDQYFFNVSGANSGGPIGVGDAGTGGTGIIEEDSGISPPRPGPARRQARRAGSPPSRPARSTRASPDGRGRRRGPPLDRQRRRRPPHRDPDRPPGSPDDQLLRARLPRTVVHVRRERHGVGRHRSGRLLAPLPGLLHRGTVGVRRARLRSHRPHGVHHVTTGRELLILDPTVVDDPVRTAFTAPATNPDTGVWTFGRLMRDMAPTPAQAPAMVLGLFQSWLTDQTVNGFTVSARPAMQSTVLDSWPRTSDGSLDLNQSPLRLLAIVNRIDTRDLAAGNAGEARFVYGVLDSFGNPLQFTVIAEYGLLANTEADVLGWANAWHALGSLPFPSEAYNAALEALTLKFSGRGVAPSRPNGSGLDQLRTNEIALSFQWELREFGLSPSTGMLAEQTIALTPDLSLNGSQALADFVNQNQAAVLADTDVLPDQFEGAPFLGGSVFNNLTTWSAPAILDNDARFQLSSNTCNGCHGPDTATTFLQIAPRFPGQAATLSGFLTGATAPDQVTGVPRTFNDLARRNADLVSLVCPAPTTGTGTTAQARSITGARTSIAKGIRRTH